jgi:uncharacterized membrane protein
MYGISTDAIAHAIHQLGALIWGGSLFFVRVIALPATSSIKAPMDRMRVRLAIYSRMFRWGWLGLLFFLGGGLWALRILGLTKWPLHVQLMAGMAAAMVLLHLAGYLGLLLSMEVAVEQERLLHAAKNNFWIRKLIWVNLFLGLAAGILGAAGGYLFR